VEQTNNSCDAGPNSFPPFPSNAKSLPLTFLTSFPTKQDDTWMDQAERDADARGAEGDRAMGDDENSDDNDYEKSAIVLAEDKKYYPSAEEVYGAGTETLVMDEDAQPLEEPIIAPLRHKKVEVRDANVPQMSNVSETYLLDMLRNPNLTRNVAVCGHLHHGKTSLMDMLVQQTHAIGGLAGKNTNETQTRYCDNRLDEQVGLHVFPNISG
jgi:U5 small nuclear ribonucleoprotein component